ncbi:MAG: DMT family transporter [Pseudomonadota bacterium]
MNRPVDTDRSMAYIFLTMAVFSWAINTVLARGLVLSIPPMTLSFFRWLIALMIILPLGYPRLMAERDIIRKHFGKLLVLSIFSISTYNTIIYLGAHYTTATNMTFVIATTPAITFFLSRIILGEKAGIIKTAGMIMALCGMMVIVFKGNMNNVLSFTFNGGDILTLISVICWAVYSVLFKHFKIRMDPLAFLTCIIVLGLPFIVPFYAWEAAVVGGFALTGKTVSALLFMGLFPSIVSYLCWNEGVKRSGPNTASVFMYLLPVIGSAIAWFFLGESLYLYHIAGGAGILAGLILAVYRR